MIARLRKLPLLGALLAFAEARPRLAAWIVQAQSQIGAQFGYSRCLIGRPDVEQAQQAAAGRQVTQQFGQG
ncbi:MAG: hypothetical protein ACK4P1_07880, partial [Aggregatilineales bacterium]